MVHHLLKLGHKHAWAGPAQVAALGCAAVLRVLPRQHRKKGLPAQQALPQTGQLLARLRLAELRARAQQNMAGPALGDCRRRHARQLQLDQLKYVKTCTGTQQCADPAHSQSRTCLDKQRGVAGCGTQTHLPAITAVCGIRAFTGQCGKVLAGLSAPQSLLRPGLQAVDLLGARIIWHGHQDLRQVDLPALRVLVRLRLAQVLVYVEL